MPAVHESCGGGADFTVSIRSRGLVKASRSSYPDGYLLAVSNLDLLYRDMQASVFCLYPKPPAASGGFDAVVAAFHSALPSLLNHFSPFAGRIVTDPATGLPAVHCTNDGAELVVADADTALASLDFGDVELVLSRLQLPYAADLLLSVQAVRFACGGFSVAWSSNHLLADGHGIIKLVSAFSQVARCAGKLEPHLVPSHDRSVIPAPRAPPAYSPELDRAFVPFTPDNLVNVLSGEMFVNRLYYADARDIERLREWASTDGCRATRAEALSAHLWKVLAAAVGRSDARCRMVWWVDGRSKLRGKSARKAAALQSYVGNVVSFAVKEAGVEEILRGSHASVAATVREAIAGAANAAHFQELVDWLEEHKTGHWVEAATVGLGSATVAVTCFASFPPDADFGFGHPALVMPRTPTGRLCSAYLLVAARPGGDGSWIMSMYAWPKLAAALESDPESIFKPVTAESLGFIAPSNGVSDHKHHGNGKGRSPM